MSRIQPSAGDPAEGCFVKCLIWETELGKIGETIFEKEQKTAIFGLKSGKNDDFSIS